MTVDLLEEVVVAPRRAYPRLPDLRVIERPGWLQIVTPSIKNGGCNEVIHSLLDEDTADARIDEAIAMYRELDLKFRWNAGPGSGPDDLGARLAKRGLERSDGRGMARRIAGVEGPAREVTVVDETLLATYANVMAEGWSGDPAAILALVTHIHAEGRQQMFVAFADGEPAAAASYLPFPRSAFLIGGVVLPRFRGRGLYRALVAARMAHAGARGIELATSHARGATSAPILEKLGFETVCPIAMYFG